MREQLKLSAPELVLFGQSLYSVDPSGKWREYRTVKPLSKDQAEVPNITPEWHEWLRGRRKIPPTEEEVERNILMMEYRKMKAKEFENMEQQVQKNEADKVHGSKDVGSISSPTPPSPSHKFPVYEDYEGSAGTGGRASGQRGEVS